MGIRGEIFSKKVLLRNRSYFFNVKETRTGDLYLNIVESKNMDNGGFDRQSVILFAEDLQEFLQGFDEALRTLERSVHEKKRTAYRNMPNAPVRGDASKSRYTSRTEADKPFGTGKPSGKYGRRSETDRPFGTGKPFGAGKPSGNYGRRSDADKPFGAGKPSGKYGRRSETDKPFGTGKPSGGPKQGRPVRVFRKDRYD